MPPIIRPNAAAKTRKTTLGCRGALPAAAVVSPVAPVTLEEFAEERYIGYERAKRTSKFMNITFQCTEKMKREAPAVVHVDGTARPQILSHDDNPGYADILEEYYKLTGIPTLINTSFNMHEEPIVCTPEDAYRCFMRTEMDLLILEDCVLVKEKQPPFIEKSDWRISWNYFLC